MDDVVIFDGVCNLCSRAVTFILARERDQALRFASAQSEAGRALLKRRGFDPESVETFVCIKGETVLVRSDAALEIARHLRPPWSALRLLRVVPQRLRDAVYDLVARNRYRWFGKRDSCLRPAPELEDRFLEDGEYQ